MKLTVATERVQSKRVQPKPVQPKPVPATTDPAWVKALFLAPAVVGSFAALVVLGQTRGVRRWLGRRRGTSAAELEAVRAQIVGQNKRRVTALFGVPPAATSAPTVTWYYPVVTAERTAMAVRFGDDDVAAAVDFFQAPGG